MEYYCGFTKITHNICWHMYRDANKVEKYPSLMFLTCFKTTLWKKQYSNIGIIIPLARNYVIYIMG